jgi:hypothetical protein
MWIYFTLQSGIFDIMCAVILKAATMLQILASWKITWIMALHFRRFTDVRFR